MHPQLEGLLDICRELSFRVVITTNGTLLPAQETMLLSSPALYKINVSLHSFEANAPGDFGAYLSGCFSFAKSLAKRESSWIFGSGTWTARRRGGKTRRTIRF